MVLPQLALQNLDFVDQLGELVVGGDGAPAGDARLRDPAQEEQLPQRHVRRREQRQQHSLLVGGPREPVSEEALRGAVVLHRREVGLQLRHQGAPSGQRLLAASQAVTKGRGGSSQSGAEGFLLRWG